jgi:hypothetical protein
MNELIKPGFYVVTIGTEKGDPCIESANRTDLVERLALYEGNIFNATGEIEDIGGTPYIKLGSVYIPAESWKLWRPSGLDRLIHPHEVDKHLKEISDDEARKRLDTWFSKRFLKKSIRDTLKI